MNQLFIEDNLQIVSKQTMDLFLKQKNPADLIAMYMFYYYTAKWQGTNKPKVSTSYTAKGLGWGESKTKERKKQLIALGMIEDYQLRDKATKKIKGWYIKVNYVWKREKTAKIRDENHPVTFPPSGSNHPVALRSTNALSANSLNALSANSLKSCAESPKGSSAIGKVKKEKTPIKKKEFDLVEELRKLRLPESQRHIRIIGWYLSEIKPDIRCKEVFKKVLRRNLKPAVDLASYDDRLIIAAYRYAKTKYTEYTLETLITCIVEGRVKLNK